MEITLQAEAREGTGKGFARRLRVAGKVPGVIYGAGSAPISISLDARELKHALATEAGMNVLVDLTINGEAHLTLARELQRDILRGGITHVDFLKIDRDQQIEAEVPIRITGDAVGVREGGVVEHHIWSVRVSCKPGDVPEHIDVDITELGLFEHLTVADLVMPAGVTVVSDPAEKIATISTPQVLKVESELDQPEVVAPEAVAEGETPAPTP